MHSMRRPSTSSRIPTPRHSRARLGALGCCLFALVGCDEGSVTSTGDEETESAAGPLDAGWDDTTDSDVEADAGLDTTGATGDGPGTDASDGDHALDVPHGGDYRTLDATYGAGCEECVSCLLECDWARISCEENADYWRWMSERDCWYAYGWVCWYVEPGNDQDGACTNYNSCMISASLQH
ncbi:hypothetical protein SAMN02745121_07354 [Nannocystis exedens]|uniref:Uncharacterized protein n=1 Tax=Nannocystis exedens TaxID=54 RepID=A0A1I2GIQ7_9BACT|nr:hypothetical protein NAEX_06693 [Nannocystis exedens]SFF17774.1 hypothetical protein SAMN02745121_07354 [Nannocystis exedens]